MNIIEENKVRDELLNILKDKSYKKGVYLLSSGKTSDFFIDCKSTLLDSRGILLSAKLLFKYASQFLGIPLGTHNQAVAGVELGGCPLATAVSMYSNHLSNPNSPLNALYVRKQTKDHGTKKMIEGVLLTKTRVVLLEDVTTTGASSENAIINLTEAGASVVGVITLVDRLDGAAELMDKLRIPFRSIFTKKDFIPGTSQ